MNLRLANKPINSITSCDYAKKYARLKLDDKKQKIFAELLLDSQHYALKYTEFFKGTIDHYSVHSREILRACIRYTAAVIIFAHNYPSDCYEPSLDDKEVTKALIDILRVIDITVLD